MFFAYGQGLFDAKATGSVSGCSSPDRQFRLY